MRFALVAALIGMVVFETHQLSGQTGTNVQTVKPAVQNPAAQNLAAQIAQIQEKPVANGEAKLANEDSQSKSRFNIAIKTSGGTQVWTDHVFRDGYRIQENALTGHFRLLDEKNVRQGWGSKIQCINTLNDLKPKPTALPTKPQHVAVLLHGLMRTAHSMSALETELEKNGIDDSIRFSYASSRKSIGDNAAALREILEDQPANTQFSFAGHSMGNIVVRHLVGDLQRDGDPKKILPRCRSMVMLGPPNQGASIARRLAPTGLFGLVTGKGGLELGPEWDEFVKKLGTPPFPFAIIAGDVSDNTIQNPLVDGQGDFVVSLEEAKLEGSEEFHTLPVLHSFLMSDAKAMKITVDFIKRH